MGEGIHIIGEANNLGVESEFPSRDECSKICRTANLPHKEREKERELSMSNFCSQGNRPLSHSATAATKHKNGISQHEQNGLVNQKILLLVSQIT